MRSGSICLSMTLKTPSESNFHKTSEIPVCHEVCTNEAMESSATMTELMEQHAIVEWKSFYFEYKKFGMMLLELEKGKREECGDVDLKSEELGVHLLADHLEDVSVNVSVSGNNNVKLEQFIMQFKLEIERINYFFHELLEELLTDFSDLERRYEQIKSQKEHRDGTKIRVKLIESEYLNKTSFFNLYRQATLLYQFVKVNHAAIEDTLIRFDSINCGQILPHTQNYYDSIFEPYSPNLSISLQNDGISRGVFYFSLFKVKNLIESTINLYADAFEKGNHENAKILMLSRISDYNVNVRKSDMLRVGIKCGILLSLCVWLLIMIITQRYGDINQFRTSESMLAAAPVYRSLGTLIILCWLYGACVWVWCKYRVNFVYVFQLNPRTCLLHFEIFEEMAGISLMFFVSAILYLKHIDTVSPVRLWFIPPVSYPLALFLIILIKLFGPGSYFSKSSTRSFLFNSLYNIFITPFGRVTFLDIFIADILTSLVKVFIDLERFLCYMFTAGWFHHSIDPYNSNVAPNCKSFDIYFGTIVSLLPFVFRFLQCIKRYSITSNRVHVFNCVKYALSASIILTSALHPSYTITGSTVDIGWGFQRVLWITLSIGGALFTSFWDVTMDWGIYSRKSPMIFARWIYSFAIVVDIFLRFSWTMTILPSSLNPYYNLDDDGLNQFYYNAIFLPMIMIGEVFRRMFWACLRVEYEHGTLIETFSQGDYLTTFIPSFSASENAVNSTHYYDILVQIVMGLVIVAVCGGVISLTYI